MDKEHWALRRAQKQQRVDLGDVHALVENIDRKDDADGAFAKLLNGTSTLINTELAADRLGRDAEKVELLGHVFGMGDGYAKSEGLHVGEIEDAAVELVDDEPSALFTGLDVKLAQLRNLVILLPAVPGQARQVSIIVDSVVVQRGEKLKTQCIPEAEFMGHAVVEVLLYVLAVTALRRGG